jgi:hypothetical protein
MDEGNCEEQPPVDKLRPVSNPTREPAVNILQIHPTERTVAGWIRTSARVVLELLRNMLVVGAAQYLAEKTKSPLLSAIAWIGYIALYAYCTAFIQVWSINLPAFTKRAWVYTTVWFALNMVIAMSLWFGISYVIFSTVREVIKAQAP